MALVDFRHACAGRRHHRHDTRDAAELLDLLHLVQEIVEVKLRLLELFAHAARLGLVDLRLRLLDQRENISHAENAGCHAIRIELLEVGELLAHTDKENRLAGDRLDRERRAAARVAVELGHNHTVHPDLVLEGLRDIDRFLTGHRIDREQRPVRAKRFFDAPELLHHLLVNLQTTRGIDNQDIVVILPRLLEGRAGNVYGIRAASHREDRDADLFTVHAQLFNGRRAVHVAGREQRSVSLRL